MATITPRRPEARPHRGVAPAADGISVRPIDRADAPALSDLYLSLSPAARRQRFLGSCGDETVRRLVVPLAQAPGWVAVRAEAGPRDGEIIGHAALLEDGRGGAEVAFVVAEPARGRGIGTRLMRALVSDARRRGLRRLVAATFGDNLPMRRLARSSGLRVVRDELDAGVEEIELALD